MDLSPRKLRYFIAVAEELHFGRAAGRLYIAQQSLSAQIRELETEIGARLLDRTTRKVELTPAGEIILAAARKALSTLDQAVEDARSAAQGVTGTLKVGFIFAAALELTRPILGEFRTRFPSVTVELREYDFTDTTAGLVDGWADVAIVRPPLSADGIAYETLFIEPRVVLVAQDHPLAARATVSVEDVLPLPIAIGRTADTAWLDFWTLAEHRTDATRPRLVHTRSQTEENEIVAAGDACSITCASILRYTPHAGLHDAMIEGISGAPAAIAWPAERRTTLVDSFVTVACEVRDRETEIVRRIEHPFD